MSPSLGDRLRRLARALRRRQEAPAPEPPATAAQPPPGAAPPSRAIRVFISSTFRDMHAERDELVKHVFPALRRLCERRGVTWGDVDLRWGVTSEEVAEGRVLPVCLAEIHRCRPYFIGLLGERYGSLPREISDELTLREPWLVEHREKSITELEILHGVLRNPEMSARALFYFRDPAYVERLPAADQSEHREGVTAAERAELGAEEAERRAELRRQKLTALKDEIRRRHREGSLRYAPREDYPGPRELGQLVLADFTKLIDELFPEASAPAPLARDAADHAAFAASRSEVYVPRKADLVRLDEHAAGSGPPLVVLGAAGIGKTALLANWVLRHRQRHPNTPPIEHYIGATPASTDWAGMLRRLLGELDRHFALGLEIPNEPAALRIAFANALHRAAAKGRVVIVLDALNQLEDRDQAPDLAWLPPEIPDHVRLILSTLPGRPLDRIGERGWPTHEVTPLGDSERRTLIGRYVAEKHGGQLGTVQTDRIARAPQATNPLFLRTLLEELRVFGAHERLDAQIAHYLAASTLPELYARVLARWEADYERERPGLVRDVMRLLWAARRGLSEPELLALLASRDAPLPQAHWAPLHLAAWESLVSRSGLLGFFHDDLRRAAEARYLGSVENQRAVHATLAEYFGVSRLDSRAVDELPWQLRQAYEWRKLYDLLADLDFFDRAWRHDEFGVRAFWSAIEANSELRLVDAYRRMIETPQLHRADRVNRLGFLVEDFGSVDVALALQADLVDRFRRLGDLDGLQSSLGNQATILFKKGRLDDAMALYKEVERICREGGNLEGLCDCLGNQALIRDAKGDPEGAMALHEEEERICRRLNDLDGLRISMTNQAVIRKARGDLNGAMTLLKEAEGISRQLGNPEGLLTSLANQAAILQERGDFDDAMALLKDVERTSRRLGNPHRLQSSLGGQAEILKTKGDPDGALALLKEAERLSRQLGNPSGVQKSLGSQAVILAGRGDLDRAMALHKEEERICRELDDPNGLQISLGNQASILQIRGDLDGAMALLEEAERICRELSFPRPLQAILGNQAVIVFKRGDLDGATALHKEKERICRELGEPEGLQMSLANRALILQARGDPDGAMELLDEAERICREHGLQAGLKANLTNRGLILQVKGELDRAMVLHKEAERISRELGDPNGVRASLGNQGLLLRARGDLDGAMRLHREAEKICRQIGIQDGLSISLSNQALILHEKGELDRAMILHKEAERICRQLDSPDGIQQSLRYQGSILVAKNELDHAMMLFKEAEQICRKLGDLDGLEASLGNQAMILYRTGDLDKAIVLQKEAERIARQLGNRQELATSLGNQAVILLAGGDLDGALGLLREAEQIFRQLGNPAGLAMVLANQAAILGRDPRQRREALRLVEDARGLARSHGLTALISQIDQVHRAIAPGR